MKDTHPITTHKLLACNSNDLHDIKDSSVDLIVTSPPYPMIDMWDSIFISQDNTIESDLSKGNGISAFKKMHEILNKTWAECDRVLKNNGFVCINIGDATRTIDGSFSLFSNHTEVINFFSEKDYSVLPDIHWRKQSNAPNKFMGSGMYPAGAYVTYEHEYILIFRKGGKRAFNGSEKERRQRSAYFWEERNIWFSDLWEIKGTKQTIDSDKATRKRSASYPFEIPYRLVNMYSIEGDTVLDPFSGLGTTSLACIAAQRNSIGVDIDDSMIQITSNEIVKSKETLNKIIADRLEKHKAFINSLSNEKLDNCYLNEPHGFKVKTRQEIDIAIKRINKIYNDNGMIICDYGSEKDAEELNLFSLFDLNC